MAGIPISRRVVEVWCRHGRSWTVGSGYVLARSLVLTAAHNVGTATMEVRLHGAGAAPRRHPATPKWTGGDALDLAVLAVPGLADDYPVPLYGLIDRTVAGQVKECTAIGFPRFKERAGRWPSAQIDGEIPLGENLDTGLLTLRFTTRPRGLAETDESVWEGMSGAAVFAGALLVGVITEHHLPEGDQSLTVIPIAELRDRVKDQEWWPERGVRPVPVASAPAVRTRSNPYPGLEPYGAKTDAPLFGRDEDLERLQDRLHIAGSVQTRSVVIAGPSGSGKSSLVLGGLLKPLRESGRTVVPSFTPGTYPVDALAAALARVEPRTDLATLRDGLRADADSPRARPRHLLDRLALLGENVVLVVDQLEEVVQAEDQGEAFLGLLSSALTGNEKLVVISTLRSEYLGRLRNSAYGHLFERPYELQVMGRGQLRQVINGPALSTGTTFDEGLVEEMIDDARGGDALPMLAYLLHHLYRDRTGGHISASDYHAVGPVDRVIGKRADSHLDLELGEIAGADDRAERRDTVLDTFLSFVTFDGWDTTRRKAVRTEFDEAGQKVVDRFLRARLLISDQESPDAPATVTLAHEALLRNWAPLSARIGVHAGQLRLRAELEPLALAWDGAGRGVDYLLRGERLRQARGWSGSGPVSSELITAFLEAGRAQERKELADRADSAAASAALKLPARPEAAIRLARAAVTDLSPTETAVSVLYSALGSGLRAVIPCMRQDAAPTWSPDGYLAVGRHTWLSHAATVWDAGGTLVSRLPHRYSVMLTAWSPDGRLATATRYARDTPPEVRMWNLDDTDPLLLQSGEQITHLAWSPTGELVTGSRPYVNDEARELRFYSREGELLRRVELDSPAQSLAWSPHGELAVGGRAVGGFAEDHDVTVWSAEGELLRHCWRGGHGHTLYSPERGIPSLAWDRSGRLAIATSGLGTEESGVIIVSAQGEARPLPLHAAARADAWLGARAIAVAWSPDGELAAIRRDAGEVDLWSADGTPCAPLVHDGVPVTALAWSHEGVLATATAHDDRDPSTTYAATLWASTGERLHTFHHEEPVRSLSWAPDSTLATTTDVDVRLWFTDRRVARTMPLYEPGSFTVRHPAHAWSDAGDLAFQVPHHSRGRGLAVISSQGRPRLLPLGRDVTGVAWSSDGRLAAGLLPDQDRELPAGLVLIEESGEHRCLRLDDHGPHLSLLSWAGENRLVVLHESNVVVEWDLVTGTRTVMDHGTQVTKVRVSPAGSIATLDIHARARIFRPVGGRSAVSIPAVVKDLAWTSGERLATAGGLAGSPGHVGLWSSTGELVAVADQEDSVARVRRAPGGTLATLLYDTAEVRLWRSHDLAPLATLGHEEPVRELSWSPTGELATVSGVRDGNSTLDLVTVWSAEGERLHALPFQRSVQALGWTANGELSALTDVELHLLPRPLPWQALVVDALSRTLPEPVDG